jgi:iron complex outermembrane receptor protein
VFLLALSIGAFLPFPLEASEKDVIDLTKLSLEELMNVEVTSVSKKKQKAWESAAAVYVITQEDIRRSGVTNIPDALRMVPGIHVGRIGSDKWAVSARGFNDRYSNKLLVLMDGRSVYTPLFSGVYWEVQDTMIEDIDRIEVIRGPGATLWGANAVNGVINIITKRAEQTQGGLVSVGGGSEERGFGALRYGGKVGDALYYRVYAKYANRDGVVNADGNDVNDKWDLWRTGFRLDCGGSDNNSFTVQGDVFDGEFSDEFMFPQVSRPYLQLLDDTADITGADLLARWTRTFSGSSDMALQAYYDWFERDHDILDDEQRHTFNVEFQHRFLFGGRQEILWGIGYRVYADDLKGSINFAADPGSRNDQIFSGFVQEEITIVENHLRIMLGVKLEHNDYTGFEYQPNARLFWTPTRNNSIWMAISRAVRTPSRSEDGSRVTIRTIPPRSSENPTFLPLTILGFGSRDFDSEEILAYEVGYRTKLREWLRFDLAAFYNVYDQLSTGELQNPFLAFGPAPLHLVLPATVDNKMEGETYGIELALECQALHWWRIQVSYSYLHVQFHLDSDSTDVQFVSDEDKVPDHQISLRSMIGMPGGFEFDLWLRYVDVSYSIFARQKIQSYLTMDARLGWKINRNIEVALVGQNLLDNQHPEFQRPYYDRTFPREIERSVYGKITFRF